MELEKEIQKIEWGFEFACGDCHNAEKLVEWVRKNVLKIEELEGEVKKTRAVVEQLKLITECQTQLARYGDLLLSLIHI